MIQFFSLSDLGGLRLHTESLFRTELYHASQKLKAFETTIPLAREANENGKEIAV
jgi:hypothetical protein